MGMPVPDDDLPESQSGMAVPAHDLPDEHKEESGGLGLTTGFGEGALHILSGGASSLAAGGLGWWDRLHGKSWEDTAKDQESLINSWTYQPKTTIGKGIASGAGWAGKQLDDLGAWAAERAEKNLGPEGAGLITDPNHLAALKTATHATTMALAPKAAGDAISLAGRGLSAAAPVVKGMIGSGPAAPLAEAGGDVAQFAPGGASATTALGRVSTATPEMADAVKNKINLAQQTYGSAWKDHVDLDALDRHLSADSLPVPGRLTAGQASHDPILVSQEMNNRAVAQDMAKFYNWQNQNLADNLQSIRESAGPDVNTTDATGHGQSLIDAYKAKDAPRVAEIDAAYQALRDANGGQFPVDPAALYDNMKSRLQNELLSGDAPASQLSEIKRLADEGNMSFEQWLNLRRNLGKVARSSADGNTRNAAGMMIDELENAPMSAEAANLKPLADKARGLARARFQDLESDPAYNAAVKGTVSADDFVKKFLVGGKSENISQMVANIGDNDLARQTMSVALIDHLRSAARLDENYGGKFASATFNKQLGVVGQKAGGVFKNGEFSTLRALGDYARDASIRPAGSWVNESNSGTTLLGATSNHVGNALRGAAEFKLNTMLPGAGSVARTLLDTASKNKAEAAAQAANAEFVRNATEPGAGLVR